MGVKKKSGVRGVSRMRAVTAEGGCHTGCLGRRGS